MQSGQRNLAFAWPFPSLLMADSGEEGLPGGPALLRFLRGDRRTVLPLGDPLHGSMKAFLPERIQALRAVILLKTRELGDVRIEVEIPLLGDVEFPKIVI